MFHYKIQYMDEIDKTTENDSGIVGAVSYGSAVDKICEYYGAENVVSLTIEEWENILSAEEVMEGLTQE